jgi:aminomuconate-semialdehyde/2-hydroxymuconate-6-semialdehyde dehydrogenase
MIMTIKNYINGELRDALSNKIINVVNPSIGKVYGTLPDSDSQDVMLAIEAAKEALPAWKILSFEQRFDLLLKLANGIEARMNEFVEAESMDNGKPQWLAAQSDIPRAISNLKFFASAQMNFPSESHHTPNQGLNYTLRQPIGVVGCISPWNLPLYLFTWKIAPALAAGNTVVAKPSEITPYTAYLLSTVCIEIGFPKGVLNIVHGLGAKVGQAIVEDKRVKAIAFTGGTVTGRAINIECAKQFKKVSLELGGKNPNIIFDDCDFEDMMATTVRSSFTNQGQICLCGSRIFIQKTIYTQFKEEFITRINQLTIGDPKTNVNIGAVVSEDHMHKILGYIELAKEEGGTILTGGKRYIPEGECRDGFFIEPTVIEGLGHLCRLNQEEIFGPVVTLIPFDTEEDAIEMANSTPYGLACTIWTENVKKAHRVAQSIDSGIVWVNTWMVRDLRTPFGGMKESGIGREGGFEAMRFFTETKNVFIKY